jgi:PAS domain S-box-containing protein
MVAALRWFQQPSPYTDDRTPHWVKLMTAGLRVTLLVCGLYSVLIPVFVPQLNITLVPTGTTLLMSLVGLFLIRRGRTQLAAAVITLFGWSLVTASAMIFQVEREPAFIGFVTVILFASLVWDKDRILAFTLLCLATWIGLVFADAAHLLPHPVLALGDGAYSWLLPILTFGFATVFLHLVIRNSSYNLALAREREHSLAKMLDDLRATTFSKDYLSKIIQSMGDSLIVLGVDGKIKTVNQATLDLLGYTEEELIDQPLSFVLGGDGSNSAGIDTLRERGFQPKDDRAYLAKDGRAVPVYFSGEVMVDEHRHMVGMVCVARDISERIKMENALLETEERYRDLVENSADLICTHDLEGNLLTVNQALVNCFGYSSAEEMLGLNIGEMLTADALARFPIYLETIQTQGAARGLMNVLDRSGEERVLEYINSLRADGTDQPIVRGIARDITERKRAEDELKRHIDQLRLLQRVDSELTRTLDIKHVLTMALDITMRLSGADAGAVRHIEGDRVYPMEFIGYPPTMDDIPLDKGIAGRVFRRQIAELVTDVSSDPDYLPVLSKTRAEIAIPLISQDRLVGILWLETSKPQRFTPEIFEFLKLITARVAVAIDNAQLYETAQGQFRELQQVHDQLAALEQLKTDMIRIAAHDLRNPLTIIGLSGGMLRRGLWDQLTPKQRDQFQNIENAAAQMQQITSNILSLERIERSAKGELNETVDLGAIVEKVFDERRPQADEKNLSYTLTLPDSPVTLMGDGVELHEAVANLVGNAIKYTPNGGCVQAALKVADDRAIVEVQDTGYGIPEDQQARLFQPFFRVRSKETRSIEGSGLGLHLVKNIIERHKGQMRLHSVYGEGSTFSFWLPLSTTPTSAASGSSPSDESVPESPTTLPT